jgi:hypothetical protein
MLPQPKFSIVALNLTGLLSLTAAGQAGAMDDIPYGVEAVAQYRSEYSYRGFILAKDSIDLQLGAQYAFNDTTYLNSAVWFGSEIGDGDFTEGGLRADLLKDFGAMTYSLSGAYRSYTNTFFEDGTNIEAAAIYHFNKLIDFSGRIAYDTGAEGWYADLQTNYYHRINDGSYFNLSGGISAVDKYYLRDGLNDVFAKLSYTYNINQSVSISPYAGTSVLLDKDDIGSDSLYAGIYFSVSF